MKVKPPHRKFIILNCLVVLAIITAFNACDNSNSYKKSNILAIHNDVKTSVKYVKYSDETKKVYILTGNRAYEYDYNSDCGGRVSPKCPLLKGMGFGEDDKDFWEVITEGTAAFDDFTRIIAQGFKLTGTTVAGTPSPFIEKKITYKKTDGTEYFAVTFNKDGDLVHSDSHFYYRLGCAELSDAFGLKLTDFKVISAEDVSEEFAGLSPADLNCWTGTPLKTPVIATATPTPSPTLSPSPTPLAHASTLEQYCDQAAMPAQSPLSTGEIETMKTLRKIVADPAWTDWNCLETTRRLKALEKLELANIPLTDLSPIATMGALKEINFNTVSGITDYSALGELGKLQRISIINSGVTNLDSLRNAKSQSVIELDLSRNNLSDVSFISGFPILKKLSLSSNLEFTDLSFVAAYPSVKDLNLSGTKVLNLLPLKTNRTLLSLNLSSTPITDISPLADMTNLENLDLTNTAINDLRPLRNLTNLKTFAADFTKVALWNCPTDEPAPIRAGCISTYLNTTKPCPPGFSQIPGNFTQGLGDSDSPGVPGFCVAAYEMKNPADVEGTARRMEQIPVSQMKNKPWVNITKDEARAACGKIKSPDFTFDLISNTEWQTIARNLEANPNNWSNKAVGNGIFSRGHSENTPPNALESFFIIWRPGHPVDWLHLRGRTLSNGNSVQDFAGNVAEWIEENSNTLGIEGGMYSGDLTNLNPKNKLIFGSVHSYGRPQNMGGIYFNSTAIGTPMAISRGGYWNSLTDAGIFQTSVGLPLNTMNTMTGFRCVARQYVRKIRWPRPPIHITIRPPIFIDPPIITTRHPPIIITRHPPIIVRPTH